MAKKTQEEIIPENPPADKPQEETFIDESNNATLAEFIGDDKPLQSEEKREEPVAPKAEEKPVEPAAPAIDPEKIKEEAAKDALEKVTKALGLDQDDELARKAKDDELVSPWKKENRNPRDWDEITEWTIKKQTILAERSKAEAEKLEADRQEAVKKQNDQVNKVWDEQLEELASLGKLPKTKEAHDELFRQMYAFNVARKQEGKPQVLNIKEFFAFHYKSPNTQPAGADAPISGSGYAPSEEGGSFSYWKDVHGAKWEDIYSS